mmetsp:Transcript_99224/g.314979  ORF Transcript_99224/g.314979 Transcript_99224/m.314979 type:complete len:672 (-) Transcript_99224:141-2156(-)
MTSIFGPLDKRQRAAHDAAAAADVEFSFEERADLLNDLLEDDLTTFPLLACPPEVLSAILLLMEVETCVRMRPVCGAMRSAIDGNSGFWHLLTVRDYADLGGLTKHYRGLRTLADAWDDSKAVGRLEWDPLMICAPPRLRYALLATGEARRRRWNHHGHALGAGWAWFSSKVCRRMAASTFLRWAPLQHDEDAVRRMMGPLGQTRLPAAVQGGGSGGSGQDATGSMKFRCGRSDAVTLSAEAVSDIYETVQRWHSREHREMMRAHFKDPEQPGAAEGAGCGGPPSGASGAFSVTPTLDAAEAAAFAANDAAAAAPEAAAVEARGAASHRIEEAQLKLALELSRREAERGAEPAGPAEERAAAAEAAKAAAKAPALPARDQDQAGLPLHVEGGEAPALLVFLKDHCLAERVESLPESLEKSIDHIVNKMTRPSTWGLLYESITEELGFRAKSAAHALSTAHLKAFDELLSGDISVTQERVCLPIWRSSAAVMTGLSRLRAAACSPELRRARCDLLRQASLEWCELEDLTEFMDGHLSPLEQAIDNFRGASEATGQAHTPHVRDIGRLMFRSSCLLDSRVFRPLCLAAYALVHEVHAAELPEERRKLTELLEGLHAMLAACDVADDHLSTSKNTKEAFAEHLVVPITAAVEHLADFDIRGHPSREGRRREDRR